jgi:ribose 5-phosphate isomerase B
MAEGRSSDRAQAAPRGAVAIASDHAGWPLKTALVADLKGMGLSVLDLGTHSADSVDYPDFARALAAALAEGRAERGVLVCGSGIGIGMAANRFRHVRAAVCHDALSARLARAHNDANVIALGARLIGEETARDALRVFLSTAFDGGPRHARRVAKLGAAP